MSRADLKAKPESQAPNKRAVDQVKQAPSQPRQPHRILPDYYADESQRDAFVRSLFDGTALYYDSINRVFSLGLGMWHRREMLLQAGLQPGMQILDLATGTGLMARPAAEIVGREGSVVGLDLSWSMLQQVQSSFAVHLVQAAAARLPMADSNFDFLSIGYALRHLGHMDQTFAECYRVLRPGGTLLALEISVPRSALLRALLKFYLGRFAPGFCRWTTSGRNGETLMRYFWDTIETCVPADTIVNSLAGAGFRSANHHVELDFLSVYTAEKEPR